MDPYLPRHDTRLPQLSIIRETRNIRGVDHGPPQRSCAPLHAQAGDEGRVPVVAVVVAAVTRRTSRPLSRKGGTHRPSRSFARKQGISERPEKKIAGGITAPTRRAVVLAPGSRAAVGFVTPPSALS